MRTHILLSTLLIAGLSTNAQVKIGTNAGTIDPSSILELESTSKAFYINRVSLTSTTDVTTVSVPKAGMMVYNTNTSAPGPNQVKPALYYFDGTAWVSTDAPGTVDAKAWLLLGNLGTVDGTNFLGTIDNVPMNLRVNNQKAGRIEFGNIFAPGQFGNVAIGSASQNNNNPTATGNGSLNSSVGNNSLATNFSGRQNSAFGNSALGNNISGDSNTSVGARAGFQNTTGSNNTYIGFAASGLPTNIRWAAAIGSNSVVSVNNGLVLGGTDVGSTIRISANVGINVTDPTQRIDFRNGHIRNRQDNLPTTSLLTPINGVTGASVAAGSTDVRGSINTVGFNNSNGFTTIRIDFQYPCTNPPNVTITAANEPASACLWYVTTDVAGFTFYYRQVFSGGASGSTASFHYHVIE